MSNTLRVIAGTLRGRSVSFPSRLLGKAELTPQKVKGALFSMLGEDLNSKDFLDLFAGSGQIAMEAISRGARVVANDTDIHRYHYLNKTTADFNVSDSITVYNFNYDRLLRLLHKQENSFDVIFLDPPYEKHSAPVQLHEKILYRIEALNLLKTEGVVVIQHYEKNRIIEESGRLVCRESRPYGNTRLTLYRFTDSI